MVSGRCLYSVARHHRRHGRQQFLRRTLAPLRHHARQHAVDGCRARRRHAACISARCRAIWRGWMPRRAGCKLFRDMLGLGEREAAEIAERFPKVQRRVGGYNLDALVPRNAANNMAHLLVGSEGTLAFTTQVELKLWPVIRNKVLGVCHFGSFYEAMDAAQHLVKLRPIAVELVDRTMIALGRDIAMFQARDRCHRARRSRCAADRRIRRRGSGRQSGKAQAARRTDGRSRLRLEPSATQMGRRGRRRRTRDRRRPSPISAPPASTS